MKIEILGIGCPKCKATEKNARKAVEALGVHDLLAEYVGPNIVHTGFHIEVAKGTPIEEVKDKVSRETGRQHCVIHVDQIQSDRAGGST